MQQQPPCDKRVLPFQPANPCHWSQRRHCSLPSVFIRKFPKDTLWLAGAVLWYASNLTAICICALSLKLEIKQLDVAPTIYLFSIPEPGFTFRSLPCQQCHLHNLSIRLHSVWSTLGDVQIWTIDCLKFLLSVYARTLKGNLEVYFRIILTSQTFAEFSPLNTEVVLLSDHFQKSPLKVHA